MSIALGYERIYYPVGASALLVTHPAVFCDRRRFPFGEGSFNREGGELWDATRHVWFTMIRLANRTAPLSFDNKQRLGSCQSRSPCIVVREVSRTNPPVGAGYGKNHFILLGDKGYMVIPVSLKVMMQYALLFKAGLGTDG